MARYIDEALVNAKLKEICDDYATSYGKKYGGRAEMFARLTEDIPTADVVEVRHGKWTLHTDGSGTCSECRKTQKNVWDCDRWQNYCGHCGARMDGDAE